MIYRLIDLPANVIGFKALWHVTDKDFEEVLIPSVQDHVVKTGKLNCLLILNNSVQHFRMSILNGLRHLMNWKNNWQRVAIVSESRITKLFINLLSTLVAGEFRVFSINEQDKAIDWVAKGTKH